MKFRTSIHLLGVEHHAALWTKDSENLHLLKKSDFEGLDMYRG